jgi:hypothetical protein
VNAPLIRARSLALALAAVAGEVPRQGHSRPTTYRVLYRPDTTNHCPGCGRSHWHVGRFSAECAFCGTALEIMGCGSRHGFSPAKWRAAA